MKKSILFVIALSALISCGLKEEFQPVGTIRYSKPEAYKTYSDSDFKHITTIAELAATYSPEKPYVVSKDLVIKGRVSTTDQPGNFYKSFYIQDETGGMEIKMGKNGLYNDFLPGQTVYVKLKGLTVGMYGYKTGNYGGMGMVQVGFSDPSGEYETSYFELAQIIDDHILRGDPNDIEKVIPQTVIESQLPNPKSDTQATNSLIGKLVTLKGLMYSDETFVLLYLDSNKNKKAPENRVFLSDSNGNGKFGPSLAHGITTWAMSKSKMTEHLLNGDWDDAKVGSGSTYLLDDDNKEVTVGHAWIKGEPDGKGHYSYPGIEKAAYSVSQYFKMGSTEIQIRTSGYCKFCDKEIPADILNGRKTLTVTGILTIYQGSFQLTVNSLSDFVVDGKPLE